jgi:serine/threonine protein kinase
MRRAQSAPANFYDPFSDFDRARAVVLGAGGFGNVYAWLGEDNQYYVFKEFRRSKSKFTSQDFDREVSCLKKLARVPDIPDQLKVKLVAARPFKSKFYIVTTNLGEGTLQSLLYTPLVKLRVSYSEEEARRFDELAKECCLQVVCLIVLMKNFGMDHCDVNPSNIVYRRNVNKEKLSFPGFSIIPKYFVYIVDFGCCDLGAEAVMCNDLHYFMDSVRVNLISICTTPFLSELKTLIDTTRNYHQTDKRFPKLTAEMVLAKPWFDKYRMLRAR